MMQQIARMRGTVGALTVVLLLGVTALAGAEPKDTSVRPQVIDRDTHFDANAIDMWVTNHGSFAYDIEGSNSGLIYPKGGQNTAVFAAGLWVGATVGGEPRVIVNEYSWESTPGPIIGSGEDATYDEDWNTNEAYRVYKINRGDDDSNPDYAEWPVEDGAPVDENGDPLVIGDQTLWAVYHDLDESRHNNGSGSTAPLGLEIQQTTFGFNLSGPLSNVAFVKFLIINKGANTLEDTYVSVWSDPDLGGAGDDLVGCNVDLSLGYCYNATNRDNQYGSSPPAMGIDFFQGPIVPSEGDTAYVSGVPIPDFRNLGMSSFNKYINGTDPNDATQTYNYMRGLTASGAPLEDPTTGEVTNYAVNGDPVSSTGWLDNSPADRRLMLSSGPFTMAPGDTQEVVTAIIMGQGSDRITSISALRFNDQFAQAAFDANFDLPAAPPAPDVVVSELDEAITLTWSEASETEYAEPGYAFEGYNVYQLASPDPNAERRIVATYDVNNGTGIIFDDQFDLATGVVVNSPVQFGSDAGIAHTITITEDRILGGELNNATEYYYLVTAYSYNSEGVAGLKTLESEFRPITAVPQSPTAGTVLEDGLPGTVLDVEHIQGDSDGQVIATVVDPSATTGDTYRLSFSNVEVPDGKGGTEERLAWSVMTTDGRMVLEDQLNQADDNNYLVADGILWKVVDGTGGWRRANDGDIQIDEIAGPGGTEIPPDENGGPGNAVWHDENSTGEWRISAGGGDGGEGRFTRDGGDEANLDFRDVEMRWDNDPDNYGWWVFDDDSASPIPFGLYHVDPFTGEEERLAALFFSGGQTPGLYDMAPHPDSLMDNDSGFRATDWCYAYTFDLPYQDFVDDAQDGVIDNPAVQDAAHDELFARCIIASENGNLPATGTVIKFTTKKPNSEQDVFEVRTRGVSFAMDELRNDLDKIRPVPNPYRNHSNYELNQFNRRIKFTNLPEEATIRIFNLAGDLVKTLRKEAGDTSITEWDLLTDRGLPVASGLYIYHVEARDGGRVVGETTGKLAIFMEKERLNFF